MDGEVVEEPKEDVGCLVWAGLFMMAVFGSCANMPYHKAQYEKEIAQKQRIEHREKMPTNLINSVRHSYQILTR